MNDYDQRFQGSRWLYGDSGMERLRSSHVCVIGIGGVGSWAAEALARTGIGTITLVDLDEVCVSNVNRQLPALDGTIGLPKVEVMKGRIQAINPSCRISVVTSFFSESTAEQILQAGFNCVLDAIDNLSNKCLLITRCREMNIPLVTTGGAAGRTDPMQIKVTDLSFTTHDRLLQQTRKRLRERFGFSRDPAQAFMVDAVYSTEPMMYPQKDGTVCMQKDLSLYKEQKSNCNHGIGSACFVTGAFGFVAASRVANKIAAGI